jgi:hypothetical protein
MPAAACIGLGRDPPPKVQNQCPKLEAELSSLGEYSGQFAARRFNLANTTAQRL